MKRTIYHLIRMMGPFSILALIPAFISACWQPVTRPPTAEQIIELYDNSPVVKRDAGPVDDVQIYIDASIPMRNFVRQDESTPKTLYSELLEFMGTNPWNARSFRYYLFGEAEPRLIEGGRQTLSRPANDRSFYDQKWTHLGELVSNIRSKMAAGDRVVRVVVTDLVQANEPSTTDPSQSNWAFLANQIRESLRHGAWELLSFRSDYVGRHYPESGGAPFNVSEPVERPFYIMIFGPSDEMVEKASDALMAGEGTRRWRTSCRHFRPKYQMVNIEWLESETPGYLDEKPGQRNQLAIRDKPDERVLALDWVDIENRKQIGHVKTLLRFSSNNPQESCINIQSPNPQTLLSCFAWKGIGTDGQLQTGESLVPEYEILPLRRPQADTIPDLYRRRYWMNFRLKPSAGMQKSEHYIYRFTLKADPRELRLPTWVNEWSTDNDNSLAAIGCTLNLKLVLGSIVRAISADEPLYTGFFLVRGR